MDYAADSEVASVTVVAVTSTAEAAAAPGLDKEGSDRYDIKDSRKPQKARTYFILKFNLKSAQLLR